MRWKYCLFLAMLLLLPVRTSTKEDEEDGEPNEEEEEDENNDDDDDDEESSSEKSEQSPGRRAPPLLLQTAKTVAVTRTPKKRPLECYVCAFKSDTPLRSCLDPSKYRVNTITCHNVDEKCFTSVVSKASSYEAVIRGCRSGCLGSPETTCCELNRCNNQPFALPTVIAPRALSEESKAAKPIPPSIMFFVTILLILQTVVKVTIV